MRWIWLALLTAGGSAGTSLVLKRAVTLGSPIASTVGFRVASGFLIAVIVTAAGAWREPTPEFWRVAALLMVPEIGGMVCMAIALSEGDVSHVQPIFGLLPIFVTLNGILFIHEIPTPLAATGIALVTIGIYIVGLRRGLSPLEPMRALRYDRGSRYAVLSALFWSVTPLLHKLGSATVGPLMWGMSVSLGSGLVLGAVFPFMRRGPLVGGPSNRARWLAAVLAAAVPFSVQQLALQLALPRAQAGYVMAVSSVSTLLATGLAVLLFREPNATTRIPGAILVTAGAALIALGA